MYSMLQKYHVIEKTTETSSHHARTYFTMASSQKPCNCSQKTTASLKAAPLSLCNSANAMSNIFDK